MTLGFGSAAAIGAVAAKVIPAVGIASTLVAGTGKLAATVGTAIKAGTALIGLGKLAILPALIAAIAYYHYDVFDPENRVFNQQTILNDYDFIIVGGGSAGAVLANRLTEIPSWRVLLLEAGGYENEVTDVPILSLYLHKSKLDWRYRQVVTALPTHVNR
jgi:choline dehydrogenase